MKLLRRLVLEMLRPLVSLYSAFSLFFSFTLLPTLVASDCECGYAAAVGFDVERFVFTDLIESNFLIVKDISQDKDVS